MSTSPTPPSGTGPTLAPAFTPMKRADFEEQCYGLMWFLLERVGLGWKSTLLSLATMGTFLAEHYTQSGKPIGHDPAFFAALATAIALALKKS